MPTVRIRNVILSIFAVMALAACQSETSVLQPADSDVVPLDRPLDLTDEQLLDLVQQQTFKYFWEFAHSGSGMALERSQASAYDGRGKDIVTTGGTGFGVMAIVVAAERRWVTRDRATQHLLKITNFLSSVDRFHGAFAHWYDGENGQVIELFNNDNGGDIVETAFLIQGLLAARQYFDGSNADEAKLRSEITRLWNDVEWDWYTQGDDLLYWHWSADKGWIINHRIRGHNETLIAYVLAASSPTHSVNASVYHNGYATGVGFVNGKTYFDTYELELGMEYGGPLFFAHYSFTGLDPTGLTDRYADYWKLNRNHTLINREHCIRNPNGFLGYGPNSWGLTASDNHQGYDAHSPTVDLGVIAPTAALSSFPYTPDHSMDALKHFYFDLGDKMWGPYGFYDAFNVTEDWYSEGYLALDQGPIIVMIENYRTQLIWNLFMSIPEVQTGLTRLGFESPHFAQGKDAALTDSSGSVNETADQAIAEIIDDDFPPYLDPIFGSGKFTFAVMPDGCQNPARFLHVMRDELRDDEWADQMEREFSNIWRTEDRASGRLSVGCRATMCQVSVSIESREYESFMQRWGNFVNSVRASTPILSEFSTMREVSGSDITDPLRGIRVLVFNRLGYEKIPEPVECYRLLIPPDAP